MRPSIELQSDFLLYCENHRSRPTRIVSISLIAVRLLMQCGPEFQCLISPLATLSRYVRFVARLNDSLVPPSSIDWSRVAESGGGTTNLAPIGVVHLAVRLGSWASSASGYAIEVVLTRCVQKQSLLLLCHS